MWSASLVVVVVYAFRLRVVALCRAFLCHSAK